MTAETKQAGELGRGGRMSRQRKRDAVLRLLRGEDLEMVSRSLGVTAATLTAWRDAFLAGGEAKLATRPADGEALEMSCTRFSWTPICPTGDRHDEVQHERNRKR